jgi:hypothetical protein
MDDVWIETTPSDRREGPSWVRADAIIEIEESGGITARSAAYMQHGDHSFAWSTDVPRPGFSLALLQAIVQARVLAREQESVVVLSWLEGKAGGWRMETVEARLARLREGA